MFSSKKEYLISVFGENYSQEDFDRDGYKIITDENGKFVDFQLLCCGEPVLQSYCEAHCPRFGLCDTIALSDDAVCALCKEYD